MNKIKYLGIALAATLASCSTNDFDTAPAINGNGMITAYTPQSGESTRTAYETDGSNLKVTWSAADENMYTINAYADGWTAGQLKQVSSKDNGTSANFNAYDVKGSKQVGYKAGKLFAFYPQNTTAASSFEALTTDGTTASVSLPLANQTGKLEDLHNYDYMTATADVSVNADNEATVGSLQMNHEIAVLHIAKGSEVSLASGNVTKIELSATSGLYGSGTMNVTRNGSTISSKITGTTGTITINGNFAVADNKLSEDVYVAILPATTFSGLKAKFTYDNGDSYTYNYTGSTTKFEKGKVYNWSPEIAAADKNFTLGDISIVSKRRYDTSVSTYSAGTYTVDKLKITPTNNGNSYPVLKVSFVMTAGNGNVAKYMNYTKVSCKGVYRLWKTSETDIDTDKFTLVGWYTNQQCTTGKSSAPDATHKYAKFELTFPDLKTDGSDYYKLLIQKLKVTVNNNLGVSKTASLKQSLSSITSRYSPDLSTYPLEKLIFKYKTPDGDKKHTVQQYFDWQAEN